jgi:hypothetical protein
MAANRTIKIFAVLILVLAGAVAIVIARTRLLSISQKDESRFIAAYVGLSAANARYVDNPDSLRLSQSEIYRLTKTDSAWIENYAANLSKDLSNSSRIWDEIILKLDSVRAVPPEPDSALMF